MRPLGSRLSWALPLPAPERDPLPGAPPAPRLAGASWASTLCTAADMRPKRSGFGPPLGALWVRLSPKPPSDAASMSGASLRWPRGWRCANSSSCSSCACSCRASASSASSWPLPLLTSSTTGSTAAGPARTSSTTGPSADAVGDSMQKRETSATGSWNVTPFLDDSPLVFPWTASDSASAGAADLAVSLAAAGSFNGAGGSLGFPAAPACLRGSALTGAGESSPEEEAPAGEVSAPTSSRDVNSRSKSSTGPPADPFAVGASGRAGISKVMPR
mmetsp:Transcript_103440/g.309022  ORF Transcript_103440/g.309022 Transcript_103440/m.309022 type:complete len:274 (+) Transcript_103440:208-1029(+)